MGHTLTVQDIRKQYNTGGYIQKALDGVSLTLRDNEFVAILGPSGSGKTTLLNIIGGLDRYDSGDLIINGVSTKKYRDRDWDSYRNHTIGFVFQSYNLIPHQTVLANVELALTISGISRTERRRRAAHALQQVGLGAQLHKRPSQMSGGQMQRVAIARALVNDPDILLADEPTGALDSDTSVQVMELLKEVAKDRLVVMVTHNPELAEAYATRIVTLRDGQIRADTDPYIPQKSDAPPVHKNMGKASMSFWTALSLSFNNLRTKLARTLLTSFAGSIGIIGIALILALSNGVNQYIQSVEEDTLSEYPLQLMQSGVDMASMMMTGMTESTEDTSAEVRVARMLTNMLSHVDPNDLASLKAWLDGGDSGIERWTNAIEYSYSATPQIYRVSPGEVRQVHPDKSFAAMGFGGEGSGGIMSMMMNTDVFHAMPANTALYQNQYEVKAGRWPANDHECVVVLTEGGSVSDFLLYALGLRDAPELDEMIRRFLAGEEVDMPDIRRSYTYEELLGIRFKLICAADRYQYDEDYQVWRDKSDDDAFMRRLVEGGEDLVIVGVVQPAEGAGAAMLNFGICYPAALTDHVMELAAASPIVQRQLQDPGINVLTGDPFGAEQEQDRLGAQQLFSVDEEALRAAFGFDESALDLDLGDAFDFDESDLDLSALAGALDMSELQKELPEGEAPDLTTLFSGLQLEISAEGARQLTADLVAGYGEYAAAHPEADYTQLGASFGDYLQSEDGRTRLQYWAQQLLTNVEVTVDPEALSALLVELLQGYADYVEQVSPGTPVLPQPPETPNPDQPTDPDQPVDPDRPATPDLPTLPDLPDLPSMEEYLRTEGAQAILAKYADSIVTVNGSLTPTPELTQAMIADLSAGFSAYVAANGLPDPARMGEHFAAYLQTPAARALLQEGLSRVVDTDALGTQLNKALGGYMEKVMGGYAEALTKTLQRQLPKAMQQMMGQLGEKLEKNLRQSLADMGDKMGDALQIDTDAFANAIQMTMSEEELSELMRSLMGAENATYDGNLQKFGYADAADPSGINIYPKDFESKGRLIQTLDDYNDRMEASGQSEKVIRYTDMVGTLMSSVTDIVDIISYVLVAFVSISLVVSSIMIGVITYISVLERKKEIGILRAIGASKRNISQVFNAETFIIGLCAGLIGIGATLLLILPINAIIHTLAGQTDINAALPAVHGLVLIVLSVILTLLGGLLPAKKAAKSDPVAALRSE